jgi:predicted nucleotidyltransferase
MDKHIYSIEEIRKIVSPIAQSYGIARLALFGSYARGEATADSDIDLLILEKGKLRGMFQLAGFLYDLEENLHTTVDVLVDDAVSEEFMHAIRSEEIIVYAS